MISSTWVVLHKKKGPLFFYFYFFGGVLFIRVSYYCGDRKGDPNSENYPY